jgi:DNA-directed RNA polymerase specialized sigma subunit
MKQQLDISLMDDQWVAGTTDRFFRNMSTRDRSLLQMVYLSEFSWVQIAALLKCSTQTASQQHQDILSYLRGHIGIEVEEVLE